mmetsp:Transcript_27597/g.92309  ORF Transcript_27597/g.92309 Transcript_27597/m.92309 type:complete len:231 (+) Transcript_27597:284-976(+)
MRVFGIMPVRARDRRPRLHGVRALLQVRRRGPVRPQLRAAGRPAAPRGVPHRGPRLWRAPSRRCAGRGLRLRVRRRRGGRPRRASAVGPGATSVRAERARGLWAGCRGARGGHPRGRHGAGLRGALHQPRLRAQPRGAHRALRPRHPAGRLLCRGPHPRGPGARLRLLLPGYGPGDGCCGQGGAGQGRWCGAPVLVRQRPVPRAIPRPERPLPGWRHGPPGPATANCAKV